MAWPQLDDFRNAIQNPKDCFRDPDLRRSSIVSDKLGLPKVASGNFACAYQATSGSSERWAVRTFNREVTDHQARYGLISDHLSSVGIPYMVGFKYFQEGIFVHGKWFPIVKMTWIEGITLTRYAKQNRSRPDLLKHVARHWRGMVGALYGLQMAHADLQQGNVLVLASGDLRLIDYDGMFVPAMGRQKAPELGHPNWNHPKRDSDTFGPYLDQFPGLVGYLSLLAVAAQPGLLDDYCNDDNIIFVEKDFRDPRSSKIFRDLAKLRDPLIEKLADALATWSRKAIDLMTLESVITGVGTSITLAHPQPSTGGLASGKTAAHQPSHGSPTATAVSSWLPQAMKSATSRPVPAAASAGVDWWYRLQALLATYFSTPKRRAAAGAFTVLVASFLAAQFITNVRSGSVTSETDEIRREDHDALVRERDALRIQIEQLEKERGANTDTLGRAPKNDTTTDERANDLRATNEKLARERDELIGKLSALEKTLSPPGQVSKSSAQASEGRRSQQTELPNSSAKSEAAGSALSSAKQARDTIASARSLLDRGEYGQAIDKLEAALRASPEVAELKSALADARAARDTEAAVVGANPPKTSGKSEAAGSALVSAKQARDAIATARSLLDRGEYDQAIGKLEVALRTLPEMSELKSALAQARAARDAEAQVLGN